MEKYLQMTQNHLRVQVEKITNYILRENYFKMFVLQTANDTANDTSTQNSLNANIRTLDPAWMTQHTEPPATEASVTALSSPSL